MARDILEIKKQMTGLFIANPAIISLYGLTSGKTFEEEFSKVSFESIFFYTIAFCAWSIEKLFDIHKSEIDEKIFQLKAHRMPWYRNKILDFRYGYSLVGDTDLYNNTGLTEEDIADSKIIKQCAVNESAAESRLIAKVATIVSGEFSPISDAQKFSLLAYLNIVKDAGVKITIINTTSDVLGLEIIIYRDPLVIDENGFSILNGNKPVEDAIKQYLKDMPFNGELVLAHLVDKLQQINGVIIPHIVNAESSWIDPDTSGYGTPVAFTVKKVPESGYFTITDFSGITYVV